MLHLVKKKKNLIPAATPTGKTTPDVQSRKSAQ